MKGDHFAELSAELEARYVAGDFGALIEAVLLYSDQDATLARPLPAWAWPAVVEHLKARFMLKGTGKGSPGPEEQTAQFDKRWARYVTVEYCLRMDALGRANVDWVNRTRAGRGLPALRPGDLPEDPEPFDLAHAVLRGSPARGAAKTIEGDWRRVRNEMKREEGRRP